MLNKIYAIKERMHQEFIGGKRIPVTLLSVPDHSVVRTKGLEKDGYHALVISVAKSKKKSVLRENRLNEAPEADFQVELEKTLTPGATVSVSGTSKGKGFAGVVKRWGFAGGPRTHGQSDRHRAPGSIARGTTPGRVVKGKRMAGRMGGVTQSVKNLKIVSYDQATKKLKLSGPIPGNNKSLVTIKITKLAPTA